MKLHYYPDTDSLCVEFRSEPGGQALEVTDGLQVDINAAGEIVGFDIGRASSRMDLSTLETNSLPLRSTRAG